MSAEPDRTHQKPPFLKRVRIRNYKSIKFCDVELEPLTVLVGRNGSGKSNFVDALGFLRHVVEHGAPAAVKMHGGWKAVCNLSATHPTIDIEVTVDPFDVRAPHGKIGSGMLPLRNDAIKKWQWPGFPLQVVYFVSIKGESFAGGSIVEERCDFDVVGSVRRFGFRRTPTSVTPYSTTTEDASLLPSQMLEWFAAMQPDKSILGALGVQPWLDVNEGLNGVATYNFVPSIMREHQSVNHGLMDYAGSNLPTVLLQLKEIDSETVERVRMYLSTIVPGVKSFTHVKYGDRETLQFLIEAAGKELVLDASSMSDGTLRVFASLMAAFQIGLPTGPTLVAIEEPETSLHPAAMHALVDALDEATSRTQILLTTHSTELLDTPTIQPKNVRVVEMVDGETVITGVDNATLKIVRDGLNTLGGLERNNLLELNHEQLERQKREAAAPAKGGTA